MKKKQVRKTDPTDLEQARRSLVFGDLAMGVQVPFYVKSTSDEYETFDFWLTPSPLDPDGEIRKKRAPAILHLETVLRAIAVLKEVGTEEELREKFSRIHEAQRVILALHRIENLIDGKSINNAAMHLESMKFCYDFLAAKARECEGFLEANGFRFDPVKKVASSIPKKGKGGAPRKIMNSAIVFLYKQMRQKFSKETDARIRREIRDRLAHLFPLSELDAGGSGPIAEAIKNSLREAKSGKPSRKT